jgi:hypothetical protein
MLAEGNVLVVPGLKCSMQVRADVGDLVHAVLSPLLASFYRIH